MYQAVSAVSDNDAPEELRLQFPSFEIKGRSTTILPIFYLAYIDYNKTVENIETTIELVAEGLLTISGIGNLLKLRHLIHLTKIGRLALYAEEALTVTDILVYNIGKAVIEIGSTVAQYWVDYQLSNSNVCDPTSSEFNNSDCQWYQEFCGFLLLLQLKAGAIEGAHKLMIQKSARRLIENPNRIPESFSGDFRYALHFFSKEFTEIEADFKEFLKENFGHYGSNTWNKYNDLPQNIKANFIYDFESANLKTLQRLEENGGDLIDYWKEVKWLRTFRKEISFLDSYKLIRNSEELNIEVFVGKVKVSIPTKPGSQPNQFIFKAGGVHHKSALVNNNDIPPGIARIRQITYQGDEITDSYGYVYRYYEAEVEIFNETFLEKFPDSGGYKIKADPSTFFPDEWTKQRTLEEMALAYSRKKHFFGKLFKGKMSDGTYCAFQIKYSGFNANNEPVNPIIETAHPSLKQ